MKIPEGFEPTYLFPDGVTPVIQDGVAKHKNWHFAIRDDKFPALPLKAHGKNWHIGWDIPTNWVVDNSGIYWADHAHGGALYANQVIDAEDPVIKKQILKAMGKWHLCCMDCDHPYGQDGWCDVIIPRETWLIIHPDDGGVLCFRCMTKRLEKHGLDNVPVQITSGPYSHDQNFWFQKGVEHGRKI